MKLAVVDPFVLLTQREEDRGEYEEYAKDGGGAQREDESYPESDQREKARHRREKIFVSNRKDQGGTRMEETSR